MLVVMIFTLFSLETHAASKKKKSSKRPTMSRSSKKNKGMYAKNKKTRRYKRVKNSGNGPDLKELTTASPYTEDLSNGVNSVETKQGL